MITDMIIDTITSLIGLYMDTIHDTRAAIADRVVHVHGKYNKPGMF